MWNVFVEIHTAYLLKYYIWLQMILNDHIVTAQVVLKTQVIQKLACSSLHAFVHLI